MRGKVVEIRSADYWLKTVGMLQNNWALIEGEPDASACLVYFIGDTGGVFDRMRFPLVEEASQALRRNGFIRFEEDLEARKFVAAPRPPFAEVRHPNGPIYSSGKYWR